LVTVVGFTSALKASGYMPSGKLDMQDIYALVGHAFNHALFQFANLPDLSIFSTKGMPEKKGAWMVKKMLDVIGIVNKNIFQS
jgi:hypothetical protein